MIPTDGFHVPCSINNKWNSMCTAIVTNKCQINTRSIGPVHLWQTANVYIMSLEVIHDEMYPSLFWTSGMRNNYRVNLDIGIRLGLLPGKDHKWHFILQNDHLLRSPLDPRKMLFANIVIAKSVMLGTIAISSELAWTMCANRERFSSVHDVWGSHGRHSRPIACSPALWTERGSAVFPLVLKYIILSGLVSTSMALWKLILSVFEHTELTILVISSWSVQITTILLYTDTSLAPWGYFKRIAIWLVRSVSLTVLQSSQKNITWNSQELNSYVVRWYMAPQEIYRSTKSSANYKYQFRESEYPFAWNLRGRAWYKKGHNWTAIEGLECPFQ
jgi:hypothetical protein